MSMISFYQQNLETHQATINRLKRKIGFTSLFRLLSFLLALVTFYLLFEINIFIAVFGLVFFLGALIFFVKRYAALQEQKKFYENLVNINQQEIDACNWKWFSFETGKEFIKPQHNYSGDLDVFGEGSLFQFLNRTNTFDGKKTLASWLNDSFLLSSQLKKRQEVIKELSSKVEFRQNFSANAKMFEENQDEKKKILNWIGNDDSGSLSIYKKYLRFILPALNIVLIFLASFGLVMWNVPILIFLICLGIISSTMKKVNTVHSQISKSAEYIEMYQNLILQIEKQSFDGKYLNGILDVFKFTDDKKASKELKNLVKLVEAFDTRLNIYVAILLNGVFLWDYHCLAKLDKWKSQHGHNVEKWFKAIGEVDAYNSIANYAYNNQDNIYPDIDDSVVIDVDELAHPLIDPKVAVSNSYRMQKKGEVVIITGANMAGKSTFLRCLGINMLLAYIGAPVPAKNMKFTSFQLFTSMRTNDSLSKNESYFYAELKRLKQLLDEIKVDNHVFFLLDEILKGTNSTDKQNGSRIILERLIKLGATGIIATHDLELGKIEEAFPEYVKNMCFEIEIDDSEIRFDYKLKEGITQKMNATLLMKQMGIIE